MANPDFRDPTLDQLAHRYSYHAPTAGQPERYNAIRAKILEAAILVVDLTPCCAEQARALNALDEVMFLANAAIARHG